MQLIKEFKMYEKLSKYFAEVKNKTPSEVCNLIGGKVKLNNFANVCAVRMSYAFNKAGDKIPHIEGETVSGEGKKDWYIFRVRVFKTFLNGRNYNKISSDKQRKLSPFKNKKGIIVFDVNFKDATGHVDLFNGSFVEGKDYSSEEELKSITLYEI